MIYSHLINKQSQGLVKYRIADTPLRLKTNLNEFPLNSICLMENNYKLVASLAPNLRAKKLAVDTESLSCAGMAAATPGGFGRYEEQTTHAIATYISLKYISPRYSPAGMIRSNR